MRYILKHTKTLLQENCDQATAYCRKPALNGKIQ